jgi:protein-disulfide isomerase
MDRRVFLAGFAFAPAAQAFAASLDDLPLVALPAGADPLTVSGLSWFGTGPSAIEIFDYNCSYCRTAFQTLDAMVAKKKLRLGLMDSPQLTAGSVQAAKIRQAALILYGPDKAYEFHRRLYARKGMIDGDAALAVAEEMGFDLAKLAETANSQDVRGRIIAQARFLDNIGVATTPSFIIGAKLLSGWPGADGFSAALTAKS